MKLNLALQPRRPLTRSEAWGCLMANLALPGSGSLVAGRRIGYAQLVFAFIAMGVSMVACLQSALLYLRHEGHFDQSGDPMETFRQLWQLIRWPLFGLGLFTIAMAWSVITNLQIFSGTPKTPHA